MFKFFIFLVSFYLKLGIGKLVVKNNASFSLKKINFSFLKEVFISQSFWNAILLILFLFCVFLFSAVFKRNLELSSKACDQLAKDITPKKIYDVFGIDGKNDIGVNRIYFNLGKTKIKVFLFLIFKNLFNFISFSWLIVFFARMKHLIQKTIKSTYFNLFNNLEKVNYLYWSFRHYG